MLRPAPLYLAGSGLRGRYRVLGTKRSAHVGCEWLQPSLFSSSDKKAKGTRKKQGNTLVF